MLCDVLLRQVALDAACADTDNGTRIVTQCRYPSFDPVAVFVVRFGDGFKVHDGGGALRSAWDHAREIKWAKRLLAQHARVQQLEVVDDSLVATAETDEWLMSAILTVANTSAAVAHEAQAHPEQSNEADLRDRIFKVLSSFLSERTILPDYAVVGRSGKLHRFDFGLSINRHGLILVDAVSPHHVSVSAKYVAFSDTRSEAINARLAVFDRPLEDDDASLLGQVADIVPLTSLAAGVKREMTHE